jgi:hypothetical protein
MQPDYTFAIQYNRANTLIRASQIRQRLKQRLAVEPSSSSTMPCLTYTPNQLQRLLKLMEDLTVLADVSTTSQRVRKADILADLIASNLGSPRLSSASRGPFRMCDERVVQLLRGLVQGQSPSPIFVPSPSPPPGVVTPSPSPPPGECHMAAAAKQQSSVFCCSVLC